jgi:hypothetical protein
MPPAKTIFDWVFYGVVMLIMALVVACNSKGKKKP